MEKNKVKVLINGVTYTLVTTESPEYVQRVAVTVDRKLKEIKSENPELTNVMIAMLTAINLSDENIKLEEATNNLRKQITDYAKNEKKLTVALDDRSARVKELEKEVQELKLELARNSAVGRNEYNKHR